MSYFTNLKISRKLIVAFALIIAISIGVSGFVYNRLNVAEEAMQATQHAHEIVQGVEDLITAQLMLQSNMRGYLLTNDERMAGLFQQGRKN